MPIIDWKKDVFTIPNLLSLFRLLLIPVYVSIYMHAEIPGDYFLASGILAVSCITDLIDGKIARHFNMISTLGKILDPLADKATQFTLMVCLSIRYPILRFVLTFFIIKEIFQGAAGIIYLSLGKMLPGALTAGKVCTAVLFISLILLVLMPNLNTMFIKALTVTDTIFLIWSFAAYFLAYFGAAKKVQDLEP